jgi:succinate dehydrogenase / fumarate reductase iron-sulfur subunit
MGELSRVHIKIQRFRPDGRQPPQFSEYEVNSKPGMTVNDALFMIKERLDGSVSWRVSCRMGICGSCGMKINGRWMLACQTQLSDLGTDRIVLEPLPNYAIIKDLVPDMTELYTKHRHVKPFIVRNDREEFEKPTREYVQTPKEMESYLQFAYCIMCGLCNSACPVIPTDRNFIGPQALAQVFRYNTDSRDENATSRLEIIDEPHGCWRCHFAGACSSVCPRGVDPALAIQLLRKDSIIHKIGIERPKRGAHVAGVRQFKRRPEIPEAPSKSV